MPTIPRFLDVRVLVEQKSCFLFGPRQTGKSTLIGQQFADCSTWNLLDQELFRRLSRTPGLIREAGAMLLDHRDKMTTLTERMDRLPPDRRKRVEERALALIAEEMSLRDLRKARKQTQVRVARKLGINQENVSRIEQRSDLLLSTLSGFVEAMGGKLSLVAEFPDRPPVALTGIAALDQDAPSKKSAGRDSR